MRVFIFYFLFLFLGFNLYSKDIIKGVDAGEWLDADGKHIQAHGGQVQKLHDKWWWIGEDKSRGYRSNGISLYSSTDLKAWKFEGYVMRTISKREQLDQDEYFTQLYGHLNKASKDTVFQSINDKKSVIERPKLIFNKQTGKYILWFHADGPNAENPRSDYAVAAAGIAISDNITGPYQFIKRSRLHQLPAHEYGNEWYETPSNRGFARDMNLFLDDDSTAYIIYSSEENRTMFISKLNSDFTDLDVAQSPVGLAKNGKDFIRLFPGAQREAPAMFKYKGYYYLISSGATGWDPNQARYWRARKIFGPWEDMGDPCKPNFSNEYPSTKTFNSQSTSIINFDPANGMFIYMGDRWNKTDLSKSTYVWLPIKIDEKSRISIEGVSNWKLNP